MGVWRREQASYYSATLHTGSLEDLRSLTGESRSPILRLHSDNAKEFCQL